MMRCNAFPAAPLWSMLVARMARVTRPCGRHVRKDAISQQSDCATPRFGVEGFQHGRGPRQLQDVDRSCTV